MFMLWLLLIKPLCTPAMRWAQSNQTFAAAELQGAIANEEQQPLKLTNHSRPPSIQAPENMQNLRRQIAHQVHMLTYR